MSDFFLRKLCKKLREYRPNAADPTRLNTDDRSWLTDNYRRRWSRSKLCCRGTSRDAGRCSHRGCSPSRRYLSRISRYLRIHRYLFERTHISTRLSTRVSTQLFTRYLQTYLHGYLNIYYKHTRISTQISTRVLHRHLRVHGYQHSNDPHPPRYPSLQRHTGLSSPVLVSLPGSQ